MKDLHKNRNIIHDIYNNILGQLFEPVVVLDNDKKIAYYNHYFVSFTKASPRILKKALYVTDILKGQNFDLAELIERSRKNHEIVLSEELQISLVRDELTFYEVVIKIVPLGASKNCDFLFCLKDMSVEKQLYNKYKAQLIELKSGHEQILQLEKLATMGELSADISHEINNPLAIASGYLELLKSAISDNESSNDKSSIEKYLQSVDVSIEKIRQVIVNMRNFIHKNEDQKTYCRIEDVVQSTINFLLPRFRNERITLEMEASSTRIVGYINKIKIEQVLVNLCKNAFDAIIDSKIKDGKVVISLSQIKEENVFCIHIRDNGPGIPDQSQDKIFNPFFTTKEVDKGTGLGLSISKKIVEMHNGKLEVSKTSHSGTEFTIHLPNVEISSFSYNMNQLQDINIRDGRKILVVDNEIEVLNILNKFFEEEGYVFIGSTNGPDALKFLKDIPIDLIITDIRMPEMGGSEFVSLVRNDKINCPILYLSSLQNQIIYAEDKHKYNISGFIVKPFSRDDVIRTIKHALRENS